MAARLMSKLLELACFTWLAVDAALLAFIVCTLVMP
jgi:hypothetical protein